MNIDFSVGFGKDAKRHNDGTPRNILFVGNFSGAVSTETGTPAIRHLLNIDLLDVDAAIGKIAPTLSLDEQDATTLLAFSALDDFHPDNLAQNVPAFSTFLELKQSLRDPSRVDAAMLICRELLEDSPAAPAADTRREATADVPASNDTSDDMFSRLLGQPSAQAEPQSAQVKTAMERILTQATRDDQAPQQTNSDALQLEAGLDDLLASAMRELLGSAQLKSLESAWRSVQWFGERLEADDEFSAWLVDTGGTSPNTWTQLLAARIVQEIGSADTVILLDEFDDTSGSLESLRLVTALASQIGASTFAGASAGLAGLAVGPGSIVAADRSHLTESAAEDWEALRACPGAERVAIAFPHILMRQPYGNRSDPVESFAFE